MDTLLQKCMIRPSFSGSYSGRYEISLNNERKFEVKFIYDMENLLLEVAANGKIMDIWAYIKEKHKLPNMETITLNHDHISVRVNEKDFDALAIYGDNTGVHLCGIDSEFSILHIKIITRKRRPNSAKIVDINDVEKLKVNDE